MPAVNWLAVIAAALSMFVIGGLWYGPLFAKPWQRAAGPLNTNAHRTTL